MTHNVAYVAIPFSSPSHCLAIRDTLKALGYDAYSEFDLSALNDQYFDRRPSGHIKLDGRNFWRGDVTTSYKEVTLDEFIIRHFGYSRVEKAQAELDKLLVQMAELQAQAEKLNKVIKGE